MGIYVKKKRDTLLKDGEQYNSVRRICRYEYLATAIIIYSTDRQLLPTCKTSAQLDESESYLGSFLRKVKVGTL